MISKLKTLIVDCKDEVEDEISDGNGGGGADFI